MSGAAIPGMEPEQFETRGAFHQAVVTLLTGAQREILLASGTFAGWPTHLPEVDTLLRGFFHASRVNKLRLLTTEQHLLHREAPRLLRVAREFSHVFSTRIVPAALATRMTERFNFILVDRSRMVRRFDPVQMRGVIEFNPDEADQWLQRFEALWAESTPGLAATTIGLSA